MSKTTPHIPEYCVYESFTGGTPTCPRCSSGETAHQGGTETFRPYRLRKYKCRACGYNFKQMSVETKFVMERLSDLGLCRLMGL